VPALPPASFPVPAFVFLVEKDNIKLKLETTSVVLFSLLGVSHKSLL